MTGWLEAVSGGVLEALLKINFSAPLSPAVGAGLEVFCGAGDCCCDLSEFDSNGPDKLDELFVPGSATPDEVRDLGLTALHAGRRSTRTNRIRRLSEFNTPVSIIWACVTVRSGRGHSATDGSAQVFAESIARARLRLAQL